MKPRRAARAGLAMTALLAAGCAGPTAQYTGAGLPTGSPEARTREKASELRMLDPTRTGRDEYAQAAAAVAAEDARAAAEWRQRQEAAAKQEQFEKDLRAAIKPDES